MIGRITFWNNSKGYGFITVTETERDATFQTQYFFHHSNFEGTPVLNAIVVFHLGEPVVVGKKVQAIGVRFATQAAIDRMHYVAGVNALQAGV